MEKINTINTSRSPIYSRFKFIPAAALVTVCAALAVFVVGHGYIFGNGSADNMMDAALDIVGNAEAELSTGIYPNADYDMPTECCAEPEAAFDVVNDEKERDDEVYTTTTATLAASSPQVTPNYSLFTDLKSLDTADPITMQTAGSGGTSSGDSLMYEAFDKLYNKISVASVDKAILIFAESDMDLSLFDGDLLFEREALIVKNSEFLHYVIKEDAARCFSEQLQQLDESCSPYRAFFPADSRIEALEIFLLTDSEN